MERASKVFKRVRKQRESEFVPPGQPNISYQRQYRKTRMHWYLALVYTGRIDVFAVVTIVAAAVICVVSYLVYLSLKWVLALFGVII